MAPIFASQCSWTGLAGPCLVWLGLDALPSPVSPDPGQLSREPTGVTAQFNYGTFIGQLISMLALLSVSPRKTVSCLIHIACAQKGREDAIPWHTEFPVTNDLLQLPILWLTWESVKLIEHLEPQQIDAPWYQTTMVLQYHATIVPWCYNRMVLQYHASIVTWYYNTMLL